MALGLVFVLLCEGMLAVDVFASHRGAVHTQAAILALAPPRTPWLRLCRFVAEDMTPLAWLGYVIFAQGVLFWQRPSGGVRQRPHHFATLCLASIFIWCVFDFINFYFIQAWVYLGMPGSVLDRYVGYAVAFGAIVPGMLMSGQILLNAGWLDWASSPAWRMPRWAKWFALIAGAAMTVYAVGSRNPIGCCTLWTSLIFLFDPVNLKLRRPSMFGDWQNGWYGRTLAAFAGGLMCGFLWEFWNYWALTKWVYHLPFLGSAEHFRYFEMPVVGLLGFIPFGLECWVMWQTLRVPLDGLVEELPDDRTLL
jgi:hypothetical protein